MDVLNRHTALYRQVAGILAVCLILSAGGCSNMSFPISGVPASSLSSNQLAPRKRDLVPIDISLLTQPKPDAYRLDEGDVLGLVVENVVPFRAPDVPPTLPPVQYLEDGFQAKPAIGAPVVVQADGMVALPLAGSISVKDLTLAEASNAIRIAYDDAEILKEATPPPTVTLINPRQTTVLVVREDTGQGRGSVSRENDRQGNGGPVTLPAYKNDVLNALMSSGGLPGLRAKNEIKILRRRGSGMIGNDSLGAVMLNAADFPQGLPLELGPDEMLDRHEILIPLRVPRGTPVSIPTQDIILDEGDIVYISNRETEVFYTAGLLPAGEHQLPRDYDIDIFEAMAIAGYSYGTSGNGGGGRSGGLIPQGSNLPPTELIIFRENASNCPTTIVVNLKDAVACCNQRLLVKPGDTLLLRHTCKEEAANFGIFTFFTFGVRQLFTN